MQLTAVLHSALKRTACINIRVNKHIWGYWCVHHQVYLNVNNKAVNLVLLDIFSYLFCNVICNMHHVLYHHLSTNSCAPHSVYQVISHFLLIGAEPAYPTHTWCSDSAKLLNYTQSGMVHDLNKDKKDVIKIDDSALPFPHVPDFSYQCFKHF